MAGGGKRASRQNLVKQACDACKIRKIKCSERTEAPCARCISAGIACTFNKTQLVRGPRSLREKTIRRISATAGDKDGRRHNEESEVFNGHRDDAERPSTTGHRGAENSVTNVAVEASDSSQQDNTREEHETAELLHFLDIYSQRLYPIWPIVDVGSLATQLKGDDGISHEGFYQKPHRNTNDQPSSTSARRKKVRLLAESIRLATAAQLGLETAPAPPEVVGAQHYYDGSTDDLDMLRTSFFLHVYHENQGPGGGQSLMYLRQALTMAQMMGLDREASYREEETGARLGSGGQHMRRRILLLLFVTERGVALLHKLPVILRPAASCFPLFLTASTTEVDSQRHQHQYQYQTQHQSHEVVLPAFLKLVNLFWILDQSGVFELLLRHEHTNVGDGAGSRRYHDDCIETLLQGRLLETPADLDASVLNDVQRADLVVTRQWMRAVIWRFAARTGLTTAAATSQSSSSVMNPIRIAREFLSFISQLPHTAIEAHGPTIVSLKPFLGYIKYLVPCLSFFFPFCSL